jgi:hypothetical protein
VTEQLAQAAARHHEPLPVCHHAKASGAGALGIIQMLPMLLKPLQFSADRDADNRTFPRLLAVVR